MSDVFRLEFADSEVAAVWRREDTSRERSLSELALRLSAAQVLRDDTSFIRGFVRGHMRAVELVFQGHRLPVPTSEHVGRLSQGRVQVDARWRSIVALPLAVHGLLEVELDFANGARLAFTADRMAVSLPAHPVFVESMAC